MESVLEVARKLNKEFKDDKLAIKADITPNYERMSTGAFGLLRLYQTVFYQMLQRLLLYFHEGMCHLLPFGLLCSDDKRFHLAEHERDVLWVACLDNISEGKCLKLVVCLYHPVAVVQSYIQLCLTRQQTYIVVD